MSSQEETQRREWVRTELERSLQALAMPAEVQFRLYPRGVCYACELVGDFQNFSTAYRGDNEEALTKEQKSVLNQLQNYLAKLVESQDYQCWNDEPIRTSTAWEQSREMAKQTLACFGWEVKTPPKR